MEEMKAIVFSSQTGHSKQYAQIIGEAAHLPVYNIDSKIPLSQGSTILFLGWVNRGKITGYKKAASRFHTAGVCAVGMVPKEEQNYDFRTLNKIPANVNVFYLEGGYEPQKLGLRYRFPILVAMYAMRNGKGNPSSNSPEVLNMLSRGENRVEKSNLYRVMEWLLLFNPNRSLEYNVKVRMAYGPRKEPRSDETIRQEQEEENRKVREAYAKWGVTPEEIAKMREYAYTHCYRKGEFISDPNAPAGSAQNPINVGMEGCCNSLFFDVSRGCWILTDGLGNGWIR